MTIRVDDSRANQAQAERDLNVSFSAIGTSLQKIPSGPDSIDTERDGGDHELQFH